MVRGRLAASNWSGKAAPGWRIRIGDYRVLYDVVDDDDVLVVTVVRVAHRREAYK